MLMSFETSDSQITPPPISVSYDITAEGIHGDVECDRTRAKEGDFVTITAVPDMGFVVKRIAITDKDDSFQPFQIIGDGEFEFVMPASDVTVLIEFTDGLPDLQFYSHPGLSGAISSGSDEAVIA